MTSVSASRLPLEDESQLSQLPYFIACGLLLPCCMRRDRPVIQHISGSQPGLVCYKISGVVFGVYSIFLLVVVDILPVILYGCETWSLALREER